MSFYPLDPGRKMRGALMKAPRALIPG